MQKNGEKWFDAAGNEIQCHGGYMIFFNGYYYWYGENRLGNNYVSCYRSTDLENWEFRNQVLTTESKTEPIRVRTDLRLLQGGGEKMDIERPKVLYCEKTKKFVMWAHFENGKDWSVAGVCIATCDTPDGDFVYHGHFNPYGYRSMDCTLFLDDNNRAYFIATARDDADLHVYLLADDFLNIKKHINTLWQGEYREAPAVFKKDGKYYILSSGCTGFAPNQGKYSYGYSLDGEFLDVEDFGDKTTFDSQPTFVLPLQKNGTIEYLYFGDRWCFAPRDIPYAEGRKRLMEFYPNSTYVVLPIKFDGDRPYIEYN